MFLIGFPKNLENGAQNGVPIYCQTLNFFKFEVKIEHFVAGFIDLQIYSVELRFGAPFFQFLKSMKCQLSLEKIISLAIFVQFLQSIEIQ